MTNKNPVQPSVLRGRRILVVEDDYLIAQDTADALSRSDAETLGPVAAVEEALRLIATEKNRIDGALLDVNVRDGMIWPVVDALRVQGVPLVLATGYDAEVIPSAYVGLLRFEKPGTSRDLVRALEHALANTESA